jgi:hypothetical protein
LKVLSLQSLLDDLKKGAKVYFANELHPYTVRAVGKRFAVCTKPFPLKSTVLYTIIDMEEKIRGTEDLVFGEGAESDRQCQRMVDRLENKITKISFRNRVDLRIIGK